MAPIQTPVLGSRMGAWKMRLLPMWGWVGGAQVAYVPRFGREGGGGQGGVGAGGRFRGGGGVLDSV